MMKRLMFALLLSVCILLSVSVNPLNAAATWYERCTVGGTGTQAGTGLIYISEGGEQSLPTGWYSMGEGSTQVNQHMATALTALSIGGKVTLLVDPNDGRFWPLITGILAFPAQ